MVKCDDCKQEMQDPKHDGCFAVYLVLHNQVWPRDTYHFGEPGGRCTDCGARHGYIHHSGCDIERCPVCGIQAIQCNDHIGKAKFMYEGSPKIR